MDIDTIIGKLRNLYRAEGRCDMYSADYRDFHDSLTEYIYSNHLQDQDEWKVISNLLLYHSRQMLVTSEADQLLCLLEQLKRKTLAHHYEPFWDNVDDRIRAVSEKSFAAEEYANSVENAFKEINVRVKKIYKQERGKELDGTPLMQTIFSPNNPVLVFEDMNWKSGQDVQQGYMQIFTGAILAIRNPKAHENATITKEEAIQKLVFASLLMVKIDKALRFSNVTEPN